MKEGYEIFEAYIDGHEKEIEAKEPFIVELTDYDTFRKIIARVVIAKPPEKIPGGKTLWVRDYREDFYSEPWTIKVLEELDPDKYKAVRADVLRGDMKKPPKIYGG